MNEINFMAVTVAALAAFFSGAIWNSVLFGNLIMRLNDPEWKPNTKDVKPPVWKLVIELIRCIVPALVLAWFVTQFGITKWAGGLQFGFLLWVAFHLTLLTGAVLWENEPWKLALIHVGDWLIKILLIVMILSLWQ